MDWVMARRKRTRMALLEHMGGVEFDVELAEADAMTTELSEAVFEVAPPHVKEGRWVVPAAGISCPAPEGWELAEFNGLRCCERSLRVLSRTVLRLLGK